MVPNAGNVLQGACEDPVVCALTLRIVLAELEK